ncbi:MAG: MsnO8 family LLM class oxidoreductase [Gammaproteobacteria bacterium]|nr:MsnO8 family LLM class oxidoreductase [Gammaproteobacteria bacterium]
MELAVLDQLRITEGRGARDALKECVNLAAECEALGYGRYWIAEHHRPGAMACVSPQILITRIGAATRHMRIGAAGVLLDFYSPYKVAEDFRTLETLYPGRIDLGVARGSGSGRPEAMALLNGRNFKGSHSQRLLQLKELVAPAAGRSGAIEPADSRQPQFWVLGASEETAEFAGRMGLPFAAAHFLKGQSAIKAAQAYRRVFQPSAALAEPRACLTVFALASDDERDANTLASSFLRCMVDETLSRSGPVPLPDAAAQLPVGNRADEAAANWRERMIVGNTDKVQSALTELAARAGADALAMLTVAHDPAVRAESYRLIAGAFGLAPKPAAGVAAA